MAPPTPTPRVRTCSRLRPGLGLVLAAAVVWCAVPVVASADEPLEAIHPRDRVFKPLDLLKSLSLPTDMTADAAVPGLDTKMVQELLQRYAEDPAKMQWLSELAQKAGEQVKDGKLPFDLEKLDPSLRDLGERLARNPDFRERVMNNPEFQQLARTLAEKFSLAGQSGREESGSATRRGRPTDADGAAGADLQPAEKSGLRQLVDQTRRMFSGDSATGPEPFDRPRGEGDRRGRQEASPEAQGGLARATKALREMGGPFTRSPLIRRFLRGLEDTAQMPASGRRAPSLEGAEPHWAIASASRLFRQASRGTETLRSWSQSANGRVRSWSGSWFGLRVPRVSPPGFTFPRLSMPGLSAPSGPDLSGGRGMDLSALGRFVIVLGLFGALVGAGYWWTRRSLGPQLKRWLAPPRAAPQDLSDRAMVRWLFESVALDALGPSAKSANHLAIAGSLGSAKGQIRDAARELALLYECARYLPPYEPFGPAETQAARQLADQIRRAS